MSPSIEHHPVLGEVAGPHLGAGQVGQDAHLAVEVGGHRADPAEALEGDVEAVVGQADAGHVHPGRDQLLEGGLVVGGRPDGGDDLGAAGHAPNGTVPGRRPGARFTWPVRPPCRISASTNDADGVC